MDDGLIEARRRESYVGVIGKSKTFFGYTEKIPVELVILVFVVNRDHAIVAGR